LGLRRRVLLCSVFLDSRRSLASGRRV